MFDDILCPITLSTQVFIMKSISEYFNLTVITSLQMFTYLWMEEHSLPFPSDQILSFLILSDVMVKKKLLFLNY